MQNQNKIQMSTMTLIQIKSNQNQIKNIYCEMTLKQLLITEIHNNRQWVNV